MAKLINLTPHLIRIRLQENTEPEALDTDIVIEPEPVRAFISQHNEPCESIDGIPCAITEYGEIVNLPEPEENVYYIVSMPLALQAAALGRNQDVRYPDTGKDTIRLNGQPFAVRRLLMAKIAK